MRAWRCRWFALDFCDGRSEQIADQLSGDRSGYKSSSAASFAATWTGNLKEYCFAVSLELSGADQPVTKSDAFMSALPLRDGQMSHECQLNVSVFRAPLQNLGLRPVPPQSGPPVLKPRFASLDMRMTFVTPAPTINGFVFTAPVLLQRGATAARLLRMTVAAGLPQHLENTRAQLMTDPEHVDAANTPGEFSDALSVVGDAIGDLVTGIPAPIRKNAAQALARLCTAAVEYPISLIENATAEKRAESRARVRLIDASASQLADQLRTSPEYARAAATKFAQKIVRERVNVDRVAAIAVEELNVAPPSSATDESSEVAPISEDWLNAFESEAAQMSSEQMQLLFGKILAGEIRRPSSFSIKTLKMMSQLDNQAASLFRILCSLSVSIRVPQLGMVMDARVVSIGHAGSNSLQAYGLSFDALNVLQEYGLIISDLNSYMDYRMSIASGNKVPMSMSYCGEQWALVPKIAATPAQELRLEGVSFSRSGKELLSVVQIDPNEQYTAALKKYFDDRGYTMVIIGRP